MWELFVALSSRPVWLAEDVGVAPGASGIKQLFLQHYRGMIIRRETQMSSVFNIKALNYISEVLHFTPPVPKQQLFSD